MDHFSTATWTIFQLTLTSKPNLTEEEHLELKNKELEERNTYLEAELGLLKKLNEIERRED